MKKTVMLCIIIYLIGASGFLLTAQGASEAETDAKPFVDELAVHLRERGWSEEHVQQIRDQAQELTWQEAEGADAELVAYAMTYELRRDGGIDSESGINRAQIAFELALGTREMERLGFSQRYIARTAAEGMRGALEQVQAWNEAGREDALGLIIRETIHTRVRKETSFGGDIAERKKLDQLRQGEISDPPGIGNKPEGLPVD